jgi:hypothetical protein
VQLQEQVAKLSHTVNTEHERTKEHGRAQVQGEGHGAGWAGCRVGWVQGGLGAGWAGCRVGWVQGGLGAGWAGRMGARVQTQQLAEDVGAPCLALPFPA